MVDINELSEKEGALFITFGAYLDSLKAQQGLLPPTERQHVPTIRELARSIGIHEVTLTNISNGRIKQLDLQKTRLILDEMRRRGFDTEVTDFIKYIPPDR